MKKLLFLLFLMPIILDAQEGDWFPVPSDQVSYFKNNSSIYTMRIDSIRGSETEPIYYNVRNPEFVMSGGGGSYYNPLGSWLGTSIALDNGMAIFENRLGEDIPLNFSTNSIDAQRMYDFEDGGYIDISFDRKAYLQIAGDLYDSVKYFELAAFNADGSVYENYETIQPIVLSKNYGFVRTYNLSRFPMISYMELMGIDIGEEQNGYTWDYDEMVTNYKVGDIIQINSTHEILGKSRIEEYIDVKITDEYVEHTLKVTAEDYVNIRTDTRRYYLNLLPGQTILDNMGIGHQGMITYYLEDEPWNNGYSYVIINRQNLTTEIVGGVEYWAAYFGHEVQYKINNSHLFYRYQGAGPYGYEIGYVNSEDFNWGERIAFKLPDYNVLRPDMKNVFDAGTLKGIRIDEITGNSDYHRYHTYKTAEKYLYDEEAEYIDPLGSWIGMYTDIYPDGRAVFYNQDYEPMTIESKAMPGESWVVYGEGNDEITATIASIEYQEIFPGLMDTLKIINFFDKNHEKLNHKAPVRLSKNYGLLDMPYFYWTKFNYIYPIKTINTEDNVYGFEYPFDEVFGGLELGDELHFDYSSESNPYHSKERLIEKEISDHSVKYVFEECRQYTEADTTYFESSTKTERYPIGYMPGELVFDTNIFGKEYYLNLRYDTTIDFCEDLAYFWVSPHYRSSNVTLGDRTLWNVGHSNGWSEYDNNVFVEGLGHYRAWQSDSDRGYDHIEFFRNDYLECGAPYDFSCSATGISKLDLIDVSVNPNPNNGLFKIDNHSELRIKKLLLINAQGQLMMELNSLDQGYIDIQNQAKGLYILQIVFESGSVQHQKIMIEK